MEGLDMAPGDTPAVARRAVRLAIKDARTAKGLTQSQVAEAMEWSLSKVMRIESGEVTISQNDLRPLLTHLGIRDKARVDELVQAAKASKQRQQWWDHKRYAGMLTPAMKQWFSYEAEASSMRLFYSAYFPGFLQTPEFARVLLEFFVDDLTQDEIAARIETRTQRRQVLEQRRGRPDVHLLLDESVLRRTLGLPEVLGRQLSAVLDVINEGWLTIRVAPFTVFNIAIGNWDLFYLGSEDLDHAVLYRENATRDEIIDDAVSLQRHLVQWDKIWHASYDEIHSKEMIESRAHELLAIHNSPGREPAG
ncbi:helix-turn-helix transcriptional regulator [Dactylosporangium sp. NPDC049742]|uniref:helix-turn-helix domain-containing protein n=1 Tax=Dactylosporangium sp. NPDC049742 TaxID=3154737 RepID=UPI00341E5C9A